MGKLVRIDRNDPEVVAKWAAHFDITPLQLLACLEALGTRVDDIERALQRASTKMKAAIAFAEEEGTPLTMSVGDDSF